MLVTSDTIINRKFLSTSNSEYLITSCDYDIKRVYVWLNSNTEDIYNRGSWRTIDVVDNINQGIWNIIK